MNLDGWKLIDKVGNEYLLSGSVQWGESLVVTMTVMTGPLNNDGDTVDLVDTERVGRSWVGYAASEVRTGVVVMWN